MFDLFACRLGRSIGHNRLAGDPLSRGQIFLHQDRREREHIADVVEAVAGIVGRKIGCGLEVHTQQIADGVVIFDAIEAPGGDAAGVGLHVAIQARELRLKPTRYRCNLFGSRNRQSLRRHLAGAQFLHYFFPDFSVLQRGPGVAISLEIEPADFQFRVMAKDAIASEERLDALFKGGTRRQTRIRYQAHQSKQSRRHFRAIHKYKGRRQALAE